MRVYATYTLNRIKRRSQPIFLRIINFRILAVVCLLLMIATDLNAARRSLRVDFGAWGPARSFKFDNIFCPMHYSGSALDFFYYAPEKSLVFQNDVFPDPYLSRQYCQDIAAYEPGMNTDEYLNSEIFPPDEAGLAAKVGTNQDGHVSAVRYTFLDGNEFDEDTNGYQWAFYKFWSDLEYDILIVALYGELPVQAGDFSPHIYFETPDSTEPYWSAASDGFEGHYFCFDDSGPVPEFIGYWDGKYAGTHPADGCDSVMSRDALIALYNSTDGDNWTDKTNWLIGDPCENDWSGVGCGKQGEYCDAIYDEENPPEPGDLCYGPLPDIMGLQLNGNNLDGTIPPEMGKGNLPDLLELDLSKNHLSGSIPAELGNLTALEYVYLNGNQLSGSVPAELCNLTNLFDDDFFMDYNQLQSTDAPLCAWQDVGGTQTVAPIGLVITTAEAPTIELAWDAIEYTADPGRYRAWYSTSIDGPYIDGGATTSKSEASLTIDGLQLNTTYYIVVRTETDAHPSNPNNLESEDSAALSSIFNEIFSDGFD